jgi:hypothetical protein
MLHGGLPRDGSQARNLVNMLHYPQKPAGVGLHVTPESN